MQLSKKKTFMRRHSFVCSVGVVRVRITHQRYFELKFWHKTLINYQQLIILLLISTKKWLRSYRIETLFIGVTKTMKSIWLFFSSWLYHRSSSQYKVIHELYINEMKMRKRGKKKKTNKPKIETKTWIRTIYGENQQHRLSQWEIKWTNSIVRMSKGKE